MTPDDRKSKDQLIGELNVLRLRVKELESGPVREHKPRQTVEAGGQSASQQEKLVEELRASVARQSLILRSLPMAFYVFNATATYTATWVSNQVREITGFEPESFQAGLWKTRIHPEDCDRVLSTLSRISELGSIRNEYRWLAANGEYRWFADNAAMVRGGDVTGSPEYIVGTWLDVTERKRAEEALKLTQFCMERAALATFWVGPEAQFLRVNEHACKALGYTREELCRMHVYDIDPDFPREHWPEHWAKLRAVGAMHFETIHRRKDGTMFPVEINNNYLEYHGQEFDFSFARDISERKRAEEEKARLEEQVRQVQKLESLGVLAGGIAHDFNNLLMAILGNADLALEDLSDVSPARPMIEEVGRTARRAAELCKQMLAYSGRGRFVIRPVDLSEVVKEMSHMLDIPTSKKAALRYTLAPDLPSVEADPTQIRQIVMNLIINASEAIGDQNGIVSITTGAMECDRHYLSGVHVDENLPEGRYAFIEVSDTGCGMDQETVAKIFDPFFTTKFMGRGLGLAATLGIVRSHRGAIKIYSEPERGTTFKVLFPARAASEEPASNGQTAPSGWKGEGVVLVVDDEETIRTLGKQMLTRLGFKALVATDGRDALRVYQEHADEIRCVLLDLTMPQMDGAETFRELRRINPGVRVIMTSGYNEQDVVNQFAGKGLAGFIQKPYALPDLSATLKGALQQQ